MVPLDYASAASPRIRVGFRWLPASGHATGTVLAVEGGPGFATTGTQGAYLAMMGPLKRTRNLLLVNLRGTGNSTVIDCRGLEHAGSRQYGQRFNRLVAACGRQLNHTWHYRGGGWVHASDLFNTAYTATGRVRGAAGAAPGPGRPVRRLLRKLVLAGLRLPLPGQLRSVTLDSTYQVLGLDPWYTTTVITARRAFAQACRAVGGLCGGHGGRRSVPGPGSVPWPARLARAPVTGQTTLARRHQGHGHRDRADPGEPGQQRRLRPGRLP